MRKRRIDLNLLQKEVAQILGVKKVSVCNWENNRSKPHIHFLPKIIELLGYIPFELSKKTTEEEILYYRKVHGLTQRKLAELLKVDETTIRDWESGKHKPGKKFSKTIEKVLI